jgi:hypothetical protein
LAGGFIFTEYLYRGRAVLPRHCHEMAYFSFVLNGSYVEQCFQKQVRRCDSEKVLYHPAGEAHSDAFGSSTLREYELQAEEFSPTARSPGWRGGRTGPLLRRTTDLLCSWKPRP